jgi:hypothetical protein
MEYFEKPLGRNVRFLLPSLKLKQPCPGERTAEGAVHDFLMEQFGYWRDEDGAYSYGEHREFTVALPVDSPAALDELKRFLGYISRMLGEKCLYVDVAGTAMLLYGEPEAMGTRRVVAA